MRVRDRMVARGPDDEGLWQSSYAALGHRRLSVIDLSDKAHQPMGTADGLLWCVYNGEVYNFMALRETLCKKGYPFTSQSDTEVLLHGYREWGEALPEYLEGMFAFAIWDQADRQVFLARDRMGKKPLYYWRQGSTFWFASSLKALAEELPALTLNYRALDHFLRYRYVPDSLCIYNEVHRVPPATSLVVSAEGIKEQQYWRLTPSSHAEQLSFADALEQVEAALERAVARRLIADVPIGVFLSGGIDSTAIAALCARLKPDIRAYHVTSANNNERVYAEQVARHLGIDLEVIDADEASWDQVVEAHSLFGEPFADPASLNSVLVSQMARVHITVALSGDGGDEVFAGYGDPVREVRGQQVRRLLRTEVAASLATVLQRLPGRQSKQVSRFLGEALVSPLQRLQRRDLLSGFDGPVYTQDVERVLLDWNALDCFEEHLDAFADANPLKKLLYADMKMRLVGEFLPKVDVTSMSRSLEVRSPFLDREVVELGMGLPAPYLATSFQSKHILRKLVSRLVASDVVDRPKQGFQYPILAALQGVWHRQALDTLRQERERLALLFSNAVLDGIVDQGTWQTPGEKEVAWRMLCLVFWMRTANVAWN